MKLFFRKYLLTLLIVLYSIASCSTSEKSKETVSPVVTSAPISNETYEEQILNPRNYDRVEDYFVNDRAHFKKFLDKYWDKLVIKNGYTKEEYINNFQERSAKKGLRVWLADSVQKFNNLGFTTHEGKLFSFYFINRNKTRTIFYSHGNVSPLAYWAEFAAALSERFKDFNVVFVHSTRINHEEIVYSAEKLNSIFEEDLKSFLDKSKIDKKQTYYNIVCHSALFTYKFFKDNPQSYGKIIYYAPMIKKSPDDIVQDFKKVFDPSLVMDDFYSVYYLYSLTTPRGTRSFPIPLNSLKFNIATEKNLTDLYYKGLDIDIFKNKALIYADGEAMLVDDSYSMKSFRKESIIKLKNMSHHDYFSVKDKFPQYFEALEKLISKK